MIVPENKPDSKVNWFEICQMQADLKNPMIQVAKEFKSFISVSSSSIQERRELKAEIKALKKENAYLRELFLADSAFKDEIRVALTKADRKHSQIDANEKKLKMSDITEKWKTNYKTN